MTATAAGLWSSRGHAPQVEGNINNSDMDFCDAPELGGVFGLWAGIANQQSNPYFSIGGVAKVRPAAGKTASQVWLEGFFAQQQQEEDGGGGTEQQAAEAA